MEQSIQAYFLKAGLKQAYEDFLKDTGRLSGGWQKALAAFLQELAPVIEANAAGALLQDATALANLGYVKDLAILHAAKLADDLKAEEIQRVGKLALNVTQGFTFIGVSAVAGPAAGELAAQAVAGVAQQVAAQVAEQQATSIPPGPEQAATEAKAEDAPVAAEESPSQPTPPTGLFPANDPEAEATAATQTRAGV